MSVDPVLNQMPRFEDGPAEELDAPEPDAQEPTTAEDATEESEKRCYPDAGVWATKWLLPHFRRNPKRFRWDPQWWRYPEAATVIIALWNSWEQTRLDPDPRAMAGWFVNIFYPLMGRLTAEDGPFWHYSESLDRKDVPPPFPSVPAPPGWFDPPTE